MTLNNRIATVIEAMTMAKMSKTVMKVFPFGMLSSWAYFLIPLPKSLSWLLSWLESSVVFPLRFVANSSRTQSTAEWMARFVMFCSLLV